MAQCANNNILLSNLTPSYSGDTVSNSCIKPGEYISTDVIVGNIYVFSTCGQNGFNTQMTLRNSTGSVWYAYNDNFCGQQSQITWTATFTGSVRILIDESPACGHNTTCQEIWVTRQCQANAGSVSINKNGSAASSPIYLCEGQDTMLLQSNNDYTLPTADSGETAELMYAVYSCLPSHSNPLLDSCFTNVYLPDKNFLDANPGTLATGAKYFIVPITVDDGNNGGNPNGQINVDNNGDSCFALGTPIEAIYLSPLAFASNLDCANKSVVVNVFGGKPEYDSSNYTITNTGLGTITGLPVTHGASVTISGLNNGDFYSFSATDNNGCTSNFSGGPLSIPNAGEDTSFNACITDSTFHLDSIIVGNHDTTGKWYNPFGILKGGSFTPGISATGGWKYIVDGYAVCSNDTSFIEVLVDSLYEAGSNSLKTICQYDSIQDLWTELSNDADTNGNWFMWPNGSSVNPMLNFSTTLFNTINYKYVVNDSSACSRDSSRHRIIMRKFPNAGVDTGISICSNGAAFNMTPLLSGNPDTNGTWQDPFNNGHSSQFYPSIDSFGLYKYTVAGLSPCPDTSSFLTINLIPIGNPGISSTSSLCRSDSALPLTSLLSGNPDLNGLWISPTLDTLPTATLDPSTASSGTYTYVIVGANPCSDTSANLTLNFNEVANPGLNDSLKLCSNQLPFNLSSILQGSADTGGIWTDPNLNIHNGNFIPSSSISGIYTYTVPGNSPCQDSSSYHLINVATAPNAGIDTSINFCATDSLTNLFSFLPGNPDTNGYWIDPLSNTFSMPFSPSMHIEGSYTYKVNGILPCQDTSAKVWVNVEDPPNPGFNGVAFFCSTDSAVNLFSYLNGSPETGGIWKDSLGSFFSGTFYPDSNLPGTYLYTINGTPPCTDLSANVLVTVYPALNPGINNAIYTCSNSRPISLLNNLLGNPDTSGTWRTPTGFPHSGMLDPSTDSVGIYSYELSGIGTCQDTSSYIAVNIIPAPNPGQGDSLIYCSNDAPDQLFSNLTSFPDSNGIWTNPGNQTINGLFDPSKDTIGIYTYTVPGTSPCIDSSSYFYISVNQTPNAGSNGTIDVCESDTSFNLITVLNGNPSTTGTWKNSTGNPITGIFNPSKDSSGVFYYTVKGQYPCADSISYVLVNVVKNVSSGKDSSLVFCNNMSPINLFNLLQGNPNAGGFWTKPSQQSFNGILDPGTDSNGFYTYTVSGNPPCLNKSSSLHVTMNTLFTAGSDSEKTICQNDPPFNFFNLLNGNPDIYGTWTDPGNNKFDGHSNSINLTSGRYTYTMNNSAPCPIDTAFVDLTINQPPNAGTGKLKKMCEIDMPITLFNEITDNPDSNGLWYDPDGKFFAGMFNPSSHKSGLYTYVVDGEYPCLDDSSYVEISIVNLPEAGTDQEIIACQNTEVNLSDKLNSSSDKDGVWYRSNGDLFNGIFNGESDAPGKYYYVVSGGSFCPSDSMMAMVSISKPFDIYAGPDIYLVIGEQKPLKASSFEALRYSWHPSEGLSDSTIINPKVFTEVTTKYVVTGYDQFDCSSSDTVLVTVLPKIFIPNSFTPNGDGINDEWYIEGIDEYPDHTLHIYSKNKLEVFKSSSSRNRWLALYNGKQLPQGNYYYIIEFGENERFSNITGVITLLR